MHSTALHAALVLDIADVIGSFTGRYLTGPDIGSGPADMLVITDAPATRSAGPSALAAAATRPRPPPTVCSRPSSPALSRSLERGA
ncbi:MAG: hypothetical protein ACRDTX_19960 [Pseudonocardiaceae bacterium]